MSTEILLKQTEPLSTADKLADLQLKFEAIENKYKTMKLENNEYKKHTCQLQDENKKLQNELLTNVKNETKDAPMISDRIAFIEQALIEKDEQIKTLKDKVTSYIKTNKSLTISTNTLQHQNKQLQNALENSNHQIRILKQLHNAAVLDQHKQIDLLANENDALHKELAMYRQKIRSIEQMKVGMFVCIHFIQMHTYGHMETGDTIDGFKVKASHIKGQSSIIPMLKTALSVESYQNIQQHSMSFSGCDTLQFIEQKDNDYYDNESIASSNYDEVMNRFSSNEIMQFEEMEKLKKELSRLEDQNKGLMSILEEKTKPLKEEDEDSKSSSSSDMDELFRKCESEISLASAHAKLSRHASMQSRISRSSKVSHMTHLSKMSVASSVLDITKVLDFKKKKKYVAKSFVYRF